MNAQNPIYVHAFGKCFLVRGMFLTIESANDFMDANPSTGLIDTVEIGACVPVYIVANIEATKVKK